MRLLQTTAEVRSFEEALGELWRRGLISGELHLGIGEEAAVVGVVDRLAASSGIVGAASCTACGFALAHQQQHAGNVAVAFFGEGAANQGMLLEALNLAAVWHLPVVFVCKNSRWAITTLAQSAHAC